MIPKEGGREEGERETQGTLCKRTEEPVKRNKGLVVTMATMDKEYHEAFWSLLLLLYFNIDWLTTCTELGLINFSPPQEEQISGDDILRAFNEVRTQITKEC